MELKKIEFQQGIGGYIPLDSPSAYEFHYIVGGRGALRGGTRNYPVRGGSFFLVRPEERLRLIMDRRAGLTSRYIVRAESRQDIPELLAVARFLQDPARIVDIGSGKRNFFENLRTRLGSGNPALAEAAKYQFLSFLLDLAGNSGSVDSNPAGNEYIEEALRYMQEQIRRKITLENICEKVGLNESYFIRLFRRQLGNAPMKYFMELKLNAACNLLENTDMNISQIAEYLGFSEEFYFSRTFKKYKGHAPSNYRSMQRILPMATLR